MSIRVLGLAVAGVALSASAQGSVIDTTSGLLYHLDASTGVTSSGGSVSAWADANTNGDVFSQSTATKQPTFVASDASFNNLPAVRFDGDMTGNSGGLAPNADRLVLGTSTTPQTIIIVCDTTAYHSLGGIIGQNNGDHGIREKDANTWQGQTNGGNSNDFPTSMYINGAQTYSAGLNTPIIMVAYGNNGFSATGLGEYFDNGTNAPRPWAGDIAEVATFNRTLTTAEQQSIESQLGAKYGITVVPEPASVGLLTLGAGMIGVRRSRRNTRQ